MLSGHPLHGEAHLFLPCQTSPESEHLYLLCLSCVVFHSPTARTLASLGVEDGVCVRGAVLYLCGGTPQRKADRSHTEAAAARHITADVSYSATPRQRKKQTESSSVKINLSAGAVPQLVQCLSSMRQVVDSIPSTV